MTCQDEDKVNFKSKGQPSRYKRDVDHGHAWVYLIGVVIAAALQVGLIQTLGSLLPVLREQFSTSTWLIGLTVSFSNALGVISGKLYYFFLSG